MANTASALKRIRSSAKRRVRNTAVRSRPRSAVKKARELIAQGNFPEAEKAVAQALRDLDWAASKGVIHRNNAARRKSRLLKRLRAVQATAQG